MRNPIKIFIDNFATEPSAKADATIYMALVHFHNLHSHEIAFSLFVELLDALINLAHWMALSFSLNRNIFIMYAHFSSTIKNPETLLTLSEYFLISLEKYIVF